MAHPLRLQMLSLTTGAALSAAELAEELGIAHAAASYHARQLADAGLLQVVEEDGDRSGPGRPPIRYRYDHRRGGHVDRSDGEEALWAATAQDMQRMIRARTRHHVGADAEVWLSPEDFEEACGLAAQLSALIHDRALVGTSQALAFPSLLTLAVRRAGALQRTSAIATFTGCFEVGLASAAIVLGVVVDAVGFAGMYGVAACVSALALVPLATARAGRRAPAPAV